MNRRAIRYGFQGASIIDPVQCEHGLTLLCCYVGWPGRIILGRGRGRPKNVRMHEKYFASLV